MLLPLVGGNISSDIIGPPACFRCSVTFIRVGKNSHLQAFITMIFTLKRFYIGIFLRLSLLFLSKIWVFEQFKDYYTGLV